MAKLLAKGAVKQALDAFYAHTPKAVVHFNDLVVSSASGSWLTMADGAKYLDMNSGIGVTSTGHCHPRVVEAVQKQAAKVAHAQQNIFGAHEPLVELVDRLLGVVPPHLDRFFFCNSGAEAVDNAVKVARAATGRPNIIAFDGGFHGRTIGAMALTSSKTVYRQGFAPLMPGAFFAPYPYCLWCKTQHAGAMSGYHVAPYCEPFDDPGARACCGTPLEALKWMLKMQTAPSETAAIILEPVLGEGGFLTPPPGFMAALRALCNEHGILLIADEVQSGAARTGSWWGHAQFDGGAMQPDILVFAKGIASGYPMAGLAARGRLFDNLAPGTLGGTYGGNAVAAAAAVATIDVINEEKLAENAAVRGTQLMQGLVSLAQQQPCIIDVRGRGLMVGVEFGSPHTTQSGGVPQPCPPGFASAVTKATAKRGVLTMTAGAREAIRFLPPLTVSEEEIALALKVFGEAVAEVAAAHQKK